MEPEEKKSVLRLNGDQAVYHEMCKFLCGTEKSSQTKSLSIS